MRPAWYMYIFGVCVCECVYMSGPHGSGFHHLAPPASRNHVIRHVNAVITHHYPEVQVLATPFSPGSPPAQEADVPHLFISSGREINTEGLNLKDEQQLQNNISPTDWGTFLPALTPKASSNEINILLNCRVFVYPN